MRKLKNLHLSVIGSKEVVQENLSNLNKQLEELSNGKEILASENTFQLSFSSLVERNFKERELKGEHLPFKIAQFSPNHNSENSIMVIENIAKHFPLKIEDNKIILSEFDNIVFNKIGKSQGKDVLQVLSCHLHQDMGVIIHNQGKMNYDFDSSLFEKTPKDSKTGENYFVGKEILEFHQKGKNFGHILPGIFKNIFQAFAQEKLDMLSVDLNGSNIYTNGIIEVKRFERDYAFPLTQEGRIKGMIVYADVFFQKTSEVKNPFEKGYFLQINYDQFLKQFKLKSDEN